MDDQKRPYLTVTISGEHQPVHLDPLLDFLRLQIDGLLRAVVLYEGNCEVNVTGFRLIGERQVYPIEASAESTG